MSTHPRVASTSAMVGMLSNERILAASDIRRDMMGCVWSDASSEMESERVEGGGLIEVLWAGGKYKNGEGEVRMCACACE